MQDIQIAEKISFEDARELAIQQLRGRLQEIEDDFEKNEMDYPRKLFLIENCIYGVDIQPIAVQIAKLRCFISLIVDQKIDDTRENRGIRPLPNLETKFVAANALIGIEKQGNLRTQEVIEKEEELAKVRRKHFIARTPKTKKECRDRDTQLRIEITNLLKQIGFPGATADTIAHWNPYDLNTSANFFDLEWMFGVHDGFDVVIGNPPYVRQEQIKELKSALKKQYDCYTGVADLYVYFYECGFQLLKNNGILTYISSNKYFRSGYGEKLRKLLSNQATVHQLIDFGDAPVFTAIAYPSIIMASKAQPTAHQTRALTWEPGQPIDEFASVFQANSFLMPQKELTHDGWRLESSTVLRLLEKLRSAGKPLGEYVNGRFYYGIKTGLNEAFVVDRATRDRLIAEHPSSAEILKPFLRGRDVKRWGVENPDLYLCYVGWELPIEKYPAIFAHLKKFEAELKARPEVKQNRVPWYALSRYAADYWQEFEYPKILYQEIATYQAFAWDDSGAYSNNKTFLIPDADIYLLSLLNSKVIWFFLSNITSKLQGGAYAMQALYISQIPIPANPDKKPIETLVNQILAAKRANPTADVSSIEREIDQLVYQLYGLTPEEIAIVEESVPSK